MIHVKQYSVVLNQTVRQGSLTDKGVHQSGIISGDAFGVFARVGGGAMEREPFHHIVGQSGTMREAFDAVRKVSHTKATVLLRGETGTGKELIARAIHQSSPRADRPMLTLHCAAVPETLMESELFGHEPGAFTGALKRRQGIFERADGGTVFLDEVGDVPLVIQATLVRVLEEMRFKRVGGDATLTADVRLIAATHADLEKAVLDGTFREDLYYRLTVVPIVLPSLRERREDIPLLIAHFLDRFNREHQTRVQIAPEVEQVMIVYDWPGNVRELEHCIERLVIMADEERITFRTIPRSLRTYFRDIKAASDVPAASPPLSLLQTLKDVEKARILSALERSRWIKARAARLLGMTARQLDYRVKQYNIREPTTFL